VFLTRYDDDFFVIRDKTAVKKTMEEIGNYFEIKRSNNVEDFRRDGSSIYLSQPNLIEKWCMRFKDNIKNHKEFETPTGPGVKLCNQNMKKLSSILGCCCTLDTTKIWHDMDYYDSVKHRLEHYYYDRQ